MNDKELNDYMIDSYIQLSKYGTPSLRAYYKKLVKKLKNNYE